jgi:hypothetical protein
MINPSELRLKNYIITQQGDVMQVAGIDRLGVELTDNWETFYPTTFDNANSILLTEDWLGKFGFHQCGYEALFWVKNHNDQFVEISSYGGHIGVRYNDQVDVNLQYVHQLQNLYHTLTGQELTLEEVGNG